MRMDNYFGQTREMTENVIGEKKQECSEVEAFHDKVAERRGLGHIQG